MKVVVLVAGVNDPKWPILPEAAVAETAEHRIMSPFDEAALEMALRIRDADPATAIVVRVAGGDASAKVARSVAALNVSDVATFTLDRPWDQGATARALATLCGGADLVLLGREFGDFDDGLVPAVLAGLLGLPFFGRAQTISASTSVTLMRESGALAECLTLTGPLVASVTNDRRTRLRKPLMKNVMQARHAAIGRGETTAAATPNLSLGGLHAAMSLRAGATCEMLGGPVELQALALADRLWEARG